MSDLELQLKEAEAALKVAQANAAEARQAFRVLNGMRWDDMTPTEHHEFQIATIRYAAAADAQASAQEAFDDAQMNAMAEAARYDASVLVDDVNGKALCLACGRRTNHLNEHYALAHPGAKVLEDDRATYRSPYLKDA